MKTIKEIGGLLQAKKISSVELCTEYLTKIKQDNTASFISIDEEKTYQEARLADQKIASGDSDFLTGVPVAHKDLFCKKDWLTSCGSNMLRDFVAPYSATLVQKLENIGMPTLGKLSMDEFAMGSFSTTSSLATPKHPMDLERTVGGSSGGSASAVLAGLSPITSGSDTGGSVRVPASFCGLYGFKPTYGAISRYGMIAYASSLDTAGLIGLTCEDIALVYEKLFGVDEKDFSSVGLPLHIKQNYWSIFNDKKMKDKPFSGKKFGFVKEFEQQKNVEIKLALDKVKKIIMDKGGEITEVSLPSIDLAVSAYYILATAEAASNLSKYDGIRYGHSTSTSVDLDDLYRKTRSEGFGREVKRRILIGNHVLCSEFFDAYYLKAKKARRVILNDVIASFTQCDFLIAPVFPTAAPKFADIDKMSPEDVYLSDIYTIPFSLAGVPTVAFPVLNNDLGLPIGLQMIGSHHSDVELLGLTDLLKE